MRITNYIPAKFFTIPQKSQPAQSFGTSARIWCDEKNDINIGTNTWMFRNDLDWRLLPTLFEKQFAGKNKINIVQTACSDGSEAYSFVILLKENLRDKSEKYLPIKAYDIDDDILKAAKSGLINTTRTDRISLQMHCDNYMKYFSPTTEKLEIANDISLQYPKTHRVTKKLSDNVHFEKQDMWKVLENINDNSNTIFLCRNILGYFENQAVEKFVKLASQKLKSGSLFIIGDHDSTNTFINDYMLKNNFVPVAHNVYEKA